MPRILLRSLTCLSALTLAACWPSRATMDRLAGPSVQAAERDDDMREFLRGYHYCGVRPTPSGKDAIDAANECYGANEDKLIAALKAGAEKVEPPELKPAWTEAAACAERVPRLPDGVGSDVKIRSIDSLKSCVDRKNSTIASTVKATEDEFVALEKQESADAWFAFIEKRPDEKRVPQAVAHIVAITKKATGPEQVALEEKLVVVSPASIVELPPEHRVRLVGPKGMRAPDLKTMIDAKVSQSVILARIKASTEPYRRFDADELVVLKKMSLSDEIVAAMIEVTTKVDDRRRAEEERQALRTELATLKKMIADKQAAGTSASGEIVQTKEGPMDALASCTKGLGAMKLCEQLPFPASTVCKSTAESSFPCTKM